MKNKKDFFVILSFALAIIFLVYKLIDYFYFLQISKLIDLKVLGYENSLIVFKDRRILILSLFLIAVLIASFFYYLLAKKERAFNTYLSLVKERLEKISTGNYSIDISEIEKLEDLYDDLYKIILELRENSEKNFKDKVAIKNYIEDISHQLKTPIASMEILIALEKIARPSSNLEKIENELDKMNYLVSSLLALARFDVNEVSLKNEKINIDDLISSSLESLDSLIEDSNVKIIKAGQSFCIYGDYSWLVEAMINIIKNSLAYSKGEIKITYNTTKVYKEVRVEDNGPGFKEEDLSKVFNRFYKADEDSPGVGIGLNLAKTILNKHNATISVTNNKGGVFIIKFY
ncbi:sensor histidine kinase [Neofamilia massiliensis]|uniref:sensor histidine kinase n=1 Tax=Neofamilia massiliensis TaxID=1673724 RepID=UPI0006BB6526|nr:HAMP domain-containing sensor histidine kinase [Neofamilia massiliensis]